MHNHLALVKALKNTPAPNTGEESAASDMDIIFSQALLMEAGSSTLMAIKSGQVADILPGLVALAYVSLEALAIQRKEAIENSDKSRPVYQMLEIMRLLSEKIHACSFGNAEHYSGLYHLCSHLATDFLNADFDKAFLAYHEWRKKSENFDTGCHKSKLPDLTDCLYE